MYCLIKVLVSSLLLSASSVQVMAQEASPATAPAVVTGPIPVESFARIPFIDNATLSPQGDKIAGLLGVEGRQVLAIFSVFNNGTAPVTALIPEGTDVSWIRWANDDNAIIGLNALLPVVEERWTISRVIGLNAQSGKITRILWDRAGQNASDLLWTAKDGTPSVLIAAQNSVYSDDEYWPAIYLVDASTGKKSLVQGGREGIMDWYADTAGVVRMGIRYDPGSRKSRLLYRGADGKSSFRTIDVADNKKREDLLAPFQFLQGDRALVVHADDAGRSGIFEIDLTTQADVRTVFLAPPGAQIGRVSMSRDGQTVLGVHYAGDQPSTWLDPKLKSIQSEVDRAVGSRRARIVSMSADHGRILYHIDQPNSPGSLFYYQVADGRMNQIAVLNRDLGTRALSPVRMVSYKARDGLDIEAVLTLPQGSSGKDLPIVMLPHGGPWARDTLDYDYWAQFIASRGYAVMQPNFRGSTGYGDAFEKAGEGKLGLAMQDDISDGLAWAVKQGIADPKRACIVGASYGGYAAMWGIAKDPDLYRCAVSIAGVANLRREVNDFGFSYYGRESKAAWTRMTPDFTAVSPINHIERIKAPLLLIHGKKDIVVDFAQSQSMYNKTKAAGKSVELVALPEATHHFRREADRVALLKAIDGFLQKHNPAGTAVQSQ